MLQINVKIKNEIQTTFDLPELELVNLMGD